MAVATFVAEGQHINYTPSAAVTAGDVVLMGDMVGIAPRDISAGSLGAVMTQGVFDIEKGTDATDVFALGDAVYYSTADEEATAGEAGNVYLGTCIEAAAQTATTVRVRLACQGNPALLDGLVWEEVSLSGGSKTLDAQDVGKVLNVTGHDSNVVTLPATAAGLRYVIRAATSGALLTVSPNTNDKIMGPDIAGVDNKDHILTKATAQAGDYLVLEADGSAGWYIRGKRGIWTVES